MVRKDGPWPPPSLETYHGTPRRKGPSLHSRSWDGFKSLRTRLQGTPTGVVMRLANKAIGRKVVKHLYLK